MKHGFVAWVGVLYYYAPAALLAILAYLLETFSLAIAAIVLFLLATLAIPGYMIHYCKELDPREIFDPLRALGRVIEGGAGYWRAWLISFTALLLSFSGLLLLGVGFLVTSVWFWQAAGYFFANAFARVPSRSRSALPVHL